MNSGVTGTIIGISNANPDEIQRTRKWLQENYVGVEAAHRMIVVEGQDISINKSVATHNEMGFLEGRKFIIQEILAVLDVPPAKIGIVESANRSNSKEQDKTFRTEAISPLQYIVESVINDGFIRTILGVQNTIFVHSEGDTRDAIEQMNYYTKGQAFGNFNTNEIRAELGMAPVEGGDINFIMTPTGAVPLDRMNLYFQLPQTNTDKVPPTAQDPVSGEPMPGPTSGERVSATRSANKSTLGFDDALVNPIISAQAALVKLSGYSVNDNNLRQAYSYLNDARDIGDSRIDNAFLSLQKALSTHDEILKRGYIERAQEAMSHFIVPMNDDGYVDPSRLIGGPADDDEQEIDDDE
jgi:hypothetical protein